MFVRISETRRIPWFFEKLPNPHPTIPAKDGNFDQYPAFPLTTGFSTSKQYPVFPLKTGFPLRYNQQQASSIQYQVSIT